MIICYKKGGGGGYPRVVRREHKVMFANEEGRTIREKKSTEKEGRGEQKLL